MLNGVCVNDPDTQQFPLARKGSNLCNTVFMLGLSILILF